MIRIFQLILYPFSVIYWGVTCIRNYLFDKGIKKETSFDLPIINVGNITVGGTGKTPHVEYLVRLLMQNYRVATLSRGYGRISSGYLLANDLSSAERIGDEPYQINKKFSDVAVAVCEKRVEGVKQLKNDIDPEVIILDDAYQHRYVKPMCNILLIDYNRPIWKDYVLPAGRLRESWKGKDRADIIIITKTPYILKKSERAEIESVLELNVNQSLFFSIVNYGEIEPVFAGHKIDLPSVTCAITVTGIAKAQPFIEYLNSMFETVHHMPYKDHHSFSNDDISAITEIFDNNDDGQTVIITTEKDAVRLKAIKKLEKYPVFYIPITVEVYGDKKDFDADIIERIKTFSNS